MNKEKREEIKKAGRVIKNAVTVALNSNETQGNYFDRLAQARLNTEIAYNLSRNPDRYSEITKL